MIFERFEVPGLSQYSYLVGDAGVAVVIDPKRDVDTYLDFADKKNLRIAYVLETHIHADFASGAGALAEASGAELCLSGYDHGEHYVYAFPHRQLMEGDVLSLGSFQLQTIHTPGHTPEHVSFLLSEPGKSKDPLALFSGDFLFVGSVGRPDLLGEQEKQVLARFLYKSLQKLSALPDGTFIFPGHGAGSLCGAGMSQREQTTLGYERSSNPFLQEQSEDRFIETVLSTVPEFPDYYRRMKKLNAAGPPILANLPGGNALSNDDFAAKLAKTDVLVIDLRRPEAFGGAHIAGSYSIGAGPNLSTWSAWVVPYGHPLLLVGDSATDLDQARRSLIRIGHDTVIGYLRGGIGTWIESGRPQSHISQVSVLEMQEAVTAGALLLDVRSPNEWAGGHIANALHIPGGDLPKHTDKVSHTGRLYVICGSGYRSSVAASVLARAGLIGIINVNGGMTAWKNQNLPEVS